MKAKRLRFRFSVGAVGGEIVSQLHLRLTIPDRGPGLTVSATCDYCGKLARVRMIGNDLVCDKCLGTVEQGAGETELERCTR